MLTATSMVVYGFWIAAGLGLGWIGMRHGAGTARVAAVIGMALHLVAIPVVFSRHDHDPTEWDRPTEFYESERVGE